MSISDDASPLGLLLAVIAGRVIPIGEGAPDSPVHFDGRRFVVPRGANPDALTGELMLQAALFAIGSFHRPTLRRLVNQPRVARRYLVLESGRSAAMLRHVFPRKLTDRLDLMAPVRLAATRAESLDRALGRETLPEPASLFGNLRPLLVLRRMGEDMAQDDVADVASRRTAGDTEDGDAGEANAADGGGFLKAITNPASKGGPIADLMKLLLGLGGKVTRGSASAGVEGAKGLIARRMDQRSERSFDSASCLLANDPSRSVLSGVQRYPEWDEAHGRYRPGGACIVEAPPWPSNRCREMERVLRPGSKRLRAGLAQIGLEYELHRRQPTGDDLVLDALVALVVESQSGHAADERIYRRALRTRRDLGVLILVDTSDSTGSEHEGAEIHTMQLQAAFRLTEALDRLGDRVALAGFQSWGRGRTFFLTAKSFDRKLDAAARERILDLAPAGFTRMGAAIRHATHMLATRSGMPHRMLVVVSDGIPYDRDGYEAAIADADVARAIAEARERGCACLCLCVGESAERERVERLFGRDQVIGIARPDELDARIGSVFRHAFTGNRLFGR